MLRSRWAAAIAAVLLALGLADGANAQTLARGAIEGAVRDARGVAVLEANVRLTDLSSGLVRTTATAADGIYRFDLLPPGEYEVLVEQFGFVPRQLTAVPVRAAATQRVDVRLATVDGAAERIEREAFAGSGADRRAGTAGQWIGGLHGALPDATRELGGLGRRSSLSAGSRSALGLPLSMMCVAVDGVQLGGAQRSALRTDGFGAALFPLGALGAAEMVYAGTDVEWNGTGGGFLSGYTRRGGRALEVETFGTWTGDALTAVDAPGSTGLSFTTLQGGAVVRGPVIADTAHFLVGVEAWRMRAPTQQAWLSEMLVDEIAQAAQQRYGIDVGEQLRPGVAELDVTTLFGRFDWQISSDHALSVAGNFTALPAGESRSALEYPLGFRAGYTGRDLFTAATLNSTFGEGWTQEAKLAVITSQREYGAESRSLPNLSFVSGGLSFGNEALIPGSYEQTTIRFTEALYRRAGAHRLKLGVTADLTSHSHQYRLADAAEFVFSDPQQFAAGTGYFSQISGVAGQAEFGLPRLSAFVQDTWTAAAGLQLLLGLRYDYDRFPSDRLQPYEPWARLTGLANSELPAGRGRVAPRIGFVWDVQDSGAWVLQGSAGVHSGTIDPHLFGELITHDGRFQVRRGFGRLGGWPVVADSAAAPFVGPALSLIAPGFASPRTSQGMLGLSRQVAGGTQLFVNGVFRRTDFLPRRADLNLIPEADGADQHGRPVFGRLQQQGGLVLPANASHRRFQDFDRVTAINADGWSNHTGVTVGFDRQRGDAVRAFGSYTFSTTRDNWLAPLQGVEAQLVPAVDRSGGEQWVEGTSDFDVPHQAAVGAQIQLPGRFGVSVGGLYRFRSGYPFTPGFRTGVDINGDGSARNDPAFVDERIAGTSELVAQWGCLRGSVGGIAARNACRTDSVHALDLRFGVRVFQSGRRGGELFVDALDLIGSDASYVDRALYLVDPTRQLRQDASGIADIPLVANPDFGKPLVANTTGRVIRLGFQLQY